MRPHLLFRVDGTVLTETPAGVIPPRVGDYVAIESALTGRHTYRVTRVVHQYTDTGARRIGRVIPAPVLVDLVHDTGHQVNSTQ